MKKHGFLYTFSPVEKKGKIPSPQDNYQIIFCGPEGSEIFEKKFGTGTMEKKLSELILARNEYGWKQLHLAVLDYFAEKYQVDIDSMQTEYELIEKPAPFESFNVFRSFIFGNWEQPKQRRIPKSGAVSPYDCGVNRNKKTK